MKEKTRYLRRQHGFTLTEVMVAIAIFAIIFIAALLIYDRSNQIFRSSMEASDVQQGTRVAFEKLVAELRMAGFDFDRDGYPTGEGVYQQPDEQLEFIHPSAITFRANLNYSTDADNDHGREVDYEPVDGQFPIVTTANNEIVTYALVSDNGPNDDSITFYADVAKPRAAYPGGESETLVTIDNVDLCEDGCLNPPYTLYRITLDDEGDPVRTPLADNIRRLEFRYFSDALSAVEVTPNGGDGQYTVDATSITTTAAANAARGVRSSVQSIHMRVVGMTAFPSAGYESPEELALPADQQVASAVQHRQYALETNIVPRNLGRRGMEEPAVTPPGAPAITLVCAEGCGVVRVEWSAPQYGSVDGYSIVYDTSATGGFASIPVGVGKNLFGYVGGLNPNQTYYFKVIASNSYGSERSINTGGPLQPINYTKPMAPALTSASGGDEEGPPPLDNQIALTWDVAQINVAGSQNSCGQNAETVNSIKEVQQTSGYEIWRSPDPDFDPEDASFDPATNSQTRIVFDGWNGGTDGPVIGTDWTGSWTDSTPMRSCTKYYYAIRQKERCNIDTLNNPANADQGISAWSNVIEGEATATAEPLAPTNVEIDEISVCDPDPEKGCNVKIRWDRVQKDVNDVRILVDTYQVRRIYAASGVEDPSQEWTSPPITDPDPTSTEQLSFIDNPPFEPPSGDRWNYYVSAIQCEDLVSEESSPAAQFPCAIITAGIPSPTPLDGDGQSSPYLIWDVSASIQLSANKPIAQAYMTIYAGNTSTVITSDPSLVSHTPTSSTATFSIPLSTTMYRAVMTMIDTDGCGTTVARYFQRTMTNCCLIPIAEQSTVIQVNANVATIRLVNQCSQSLSLDRYRIRWPSATNRFGRLVSVTYPNGTVDNFGGTSLGSATSPSTAEITVPAAVPNTIPAGGTYPLIVTFQSSNPNADASTIDFCAIYPDPDDVSQDVTCSIAQSTGICVF